MKVPVRVQSSVTINQSVTTEQPVQLKAEWNETDCDFFLILASLISVLVVCQHISIAGTWRGQMLNEIQCSVDRQVSVL